LKLFKSSDIELMSDEYKQLLPFRYPQKG